MVEQRWELADEDATHAFGVRVADALDGGIVIYLHGELGAGKTSFARALLRALGVGERIKSPTYSLVEGYQAKGRPAWHLDLYRIADPGELEWLGLDALSDQDAVVLVEWPERGKGALPASDLVLELAYSGAGRSAALRPNTVRGQQLLARLR
ncbi:tRNA (adenosine(37)-N6)-threonylcarbamoyltransferase complex ATPase subunit type 1 TsaE [Dyella dinghuensis]|uniref:tRNA threonylcarbamoyladenosine biosynthesis protein TsaE n=1 Tax=Dyella dinghuensis TaxID=1920169 RepID=A0A432LY19_9GAMM|nr:tRNA (adenosine(37)-N6)-threonylcarbamoyltransferase complex ATPase subunit type 1 TsaE [Dyella dinghuensis]RUL66283.1 tRNA (adenosine(37)-N6)-threonylcarbamoyltransferase complex ATPase subunit type 1 TsaE [Dyella dinghuensis]